MDATEKHVYNHLRCRGYSEICYEPDGNIPPDFLINGAIAVEVRRLNQYHFNGVTAAEIETVAFQHRDRIKKILNSLGSPTDDESWYVSFRFSQPVEPWKKLRPKLHQALKAFTTASIKQSGIIFKGIGVELTIQKAPQPETQMFIMDECSDNDEGGWLHPLMEANIRYCVDEKLRKISNVRSHYGQWWLALVDHISYGSTQTYNELFREQGLPVQGWDKIILVHPEDCTQWFELA